MFAVVALMTGTVEQKLRNRSSEISVDNQSLEGNESVQIITALTFSIGVVLSAMAVCQIHFVSAYLSDHLTAGFTTGSACHVLWSQIPKLFAIKTPNRSGLFKLFRVKFNPFFKSIQSIFHFQIMYDFCSKLKHTNFAALILSFCCLTFLHIGKTYVNPVLAQRCSVPIPFELLVVILTTVLSNIFDFHGKHGVSVVGEIPTG